MLSIDAPSFINGMPNRGLRPYVMPVMMPALYPTMEFLLSIFQVFLNVVGKDNIDYMVKTIRTAKLQLLLHIAVYRSRKTVRIVRVDWESSEFRKCGKNSVLRAMDRESLSACRQRGLM